MMKNFKSLLNSAKAFVFDVDGVLTDGSVMLIPGGELVRTMNIKDGYALQLAIKKGYKVAIISGGKSDEVKIRLKKLGIMDIYMQVQNKVEALEEFMINYDLSSDQLLYMGDDMPDYEVMRKVSIPTCPADAVNEIKAISIYISNKTGGSGCVRDVIEQVLRLHGKWE